MKKAKEIHTHTFSGAWRTKSSLFKAEGKVTHLSHLSRDGSLSKILWSSFNLIFSPLNGWGLSNYGQLRYGLFTGGKIEVWSALHSFQIQVMHIWPLSHLELFFSLRAIFPYNFPLIVECHIWYLIVEWKVI